jgi:hypothetical protein
MWGQEYPRKNEWAKSEARERNPANPEEPHGSWKEFVGALCPRISLL